MITLAVVLSVMLAEAASGGVVRWSAWLGVTAFSMKAFAWITAVVMVLSAWVFWCVVIVLTGYGVCCLVKKSYIFIMNVDLAAKTPAVKADPSNPKNVSQTCHDK